jgi:hypothetical protein
MTAKTHHHQQERLPWLAAKRPVVFSFDAETNGLWGSPFAIAATVHEGVDGGDGAPGGRLLDAFVARCPIAGDTDVWVADNVLPALDSVVETHDSVLAMLRAFAAFYLRYTARYDGTSTVVAHVPVPVEARVIALMRVFELTGPWDAPCPLIDVASMLHTVGFVETASADAYMADNALALNADVRALLRTAAGAPLDVAGARTLAGTRGDTEAVAPVQSHHPLYDCAVAERVYRHVMRAAAVARATCAEDPDVRAV